MPVYFVFSDETGKYDKNRSDKFMKAHPFFIRASLIINSNDWLVLNQKFYQIKKDYNIPVEKEVKWSYIWSLKKDREKNGITMDKDYFF